MSAECVRYFSTNAREVEEVVRHRGVSSDEGRTRRGSQEILARVWLDCNKLTKV